MTEPEPDPPTRLLIPLAGLKVPETWRVGSVAIHPGSDAFDLIADAPPFATRNHHIRLHVEEILTSASDSSIAEVPGAADVDEAVERVRDTLDVLRLFQAARRITHTTSFGLPGDVYVSRIDYVTVSANSALGWRHLGDHVGWEFSANSYADWCASDAFQYLSDALVSADSEGQRRAVTGARLLARATREHRADLKILGVVQALEAWLLPRKGGPQARRFARHVTALSCRRDDGRRCAGETTDCPYLRLNPDDSGRFGTLASLGGGWTCSIWFSAMDWYEARNAAAHGRGHDVDEKMASSAEYATAHYLLEPILNWLSSHPGDPVAMLEGELDDIVDPAAWQQMLAALDAPDPPQMPPTT